MSSLLFSDFWFQKKYNFSAIFATLSSFMFLKRNKLFCKKKIGHKPDVRQYLNLQTNA